MASSAEYLEYVLDLLADVPEVSHRKMMGEYLLYASGKLFGGVYDDRFLVKSTESSRALLSVPAVPYEGAAEMLLVDVEDKAAVRTIVEGMLQELPEPRKRRAWIPAGLHIVAGINHPCLLIWRLRHHHA